jgi:hypothetical protein
MKLCNLVHHNFTTQDIVDIYRDGNISFETITDEWYKDDTQLEELKHIASGEDDFFNAESDIRGAKMLLHIAEYNKLETVEEMEAYTIPDITMQEVMKDCVFARINPYKYVNMSDKEKLEECMDILACSEEEAREVLNIH